MQIMPNTYSEAEMYQSSSTNDYSQDPSQATFSEDLNNALSYDANDTNDANYNDERDNTWGKDPYNDYADVDDMLSDSPYSGASETHSLFVPQPVRFTPAELDRLSKALMADGVSAKALNAIKQMAGKVGGPSLDELLGAIKQSMHVGKAPLSDKEVGLLQTLSNRINSQNPDKLYNAMRYGSGSQGIKELSAALAKMEINLSKEEINTIGKALNLSADGIAGLVDKLKGFEGKKLSAKEIENIFGDAKAEIQSKIDAYEKMQKSLEKHLKPVVDSAQNREELSRQAQMRESKDVLQSRIIIEDTVVTRVLGDDLNRSDIQEDKKSEKSSSETKSIKGNDRFTNEDGKKSTNASGSEQNILSELNKKVVTREDKDSSFPKETGNKSEKSTEPVKSGENAIVASNNVENKATKAGDDATLFNRAGEAVVAANSTKSAKPAENNVMADTKPTKNGTAKAGEKVFVETKENTHVEPQAPKSVNPKDSAGMSAQLSEEAENARSAENARNVQNAENTAFADVIAEKTRVQNQQKNPLENPLFSRGAEDAKTNEKIFNENLDNSQFLKDKEKAIKAGNIKENFGNDGKQDTTKGDDKGKSGFTNAKYEYAFATAPQPTVTPTTTGTEALVNGNHSSRHLNDVRNQVQSSIVNMAKDGVQRIEISLNPVELGQLNIALAIKNGGVSVIIQAEKIESASMINMQMDAIRAELENQGFKIDKIDVEVGLSQDNSRQEWQGMDQHNSKRETSENTQYLERLRTIGKLNASDNGTLAHNMQHEGSMISQTANSAMTGLHIIA